MQPDFWKGLEGGLELQRQRIPCPSDVSGAERPEDEPQPTSLARHGSASDLGINMLVLRQQPKDRGAYSQAGLVSPEMDKRVALTERRDAIGCIGSAYCRTVSNFVFDALF